MPWRQLGALQERNFRRLWIGQATSAVGDGLTGVALTFAVLAVHGSAAGVGFVMAAFMVPRVVFLLVGGVWADRLPRQAIMVAADVVRSASMASLALAMLTGNAQLWVFLVASAVNGTASAFFQPASNGLVPQTISAERLQQGNALLNLSQSTAFMLGPVVSGILVATVGAGWVFAFDAVTFAISAIVLMTLRVPALPPIERRTFAQDLWVGWQEVVGRRWLVASLAAFAFGNLAFASFFVLGPFMMETRFNGAPDWGLLSGLFGFGGLLGGALALRWRPARPLLATFGVLLVAPLALLLLAASPPLGVLGPGVVIFATATALANTLWHTTLQQQVPQESLSRVSSYDWMVSLLIFPLGSALAGPMADGLGATTTLVAFALLAGLPMLLVLLVPGVRAIRRTDATALQAASAPESEAAAA
jgi:MFS family permease